MNKWLTALGLIAISVFFNIHGYKFLGGVASGAAGSLLMFYLFSILERR